MQFTRTLTGATMLDDAITHADGARLLQLHIVWVDFTGNWIDTADGAMVSVANRTVLVSMVHGM